MRIDVDDEATRERVLAYVVEAGGEVKQRAGSVARVTLPDWASVVRVATWIGLDAAESCPEIVSLAMALGTPAACLRWVQRSIEWRDEPGERLAYPSVTLDRLAGDCDDVASLLVAMMSSIGYPAVVVACTLDHVPVHGVCAVQLASGWHWADGSEDRPLTPWRDHPLARDSRPGARGVITPVPIA